MVGDMNKMPHFSEFPSLSPCYLSFVMLLSCVPPFMPYFSLFQAIAGREPFNSPAIWIELKVIQVFNDAELNTFGKCSRFPGWIWFVNYVMNDDLRWPPTNTYNSHMCIVYRQGHKCDTYVCLTVRTLVGFQIYGACCHGKQNWTTTVLLASILLLWYLNQPSSSVV